jgi:hypothetical protein
MNTFSNFRLISIFFLFVIICQPMLGQVDTLESFVFDVNKKQVPKWAFKMGDNGIIVPNQMISFSGYKFILYNNDLEPINEVDIVNKEYNNVLFGSSTESLECLFRNADNSFTYYTINKNNLAVTEVKGRMPAEFKASRFVTNGKCAIITGGKVPDSQYLVFNIETGDIEVVPIRVEGFKNNKVTFDGIQTIVETGETFIYVKVYDTPRDLKYVLHLDATGDEISRFQILNEKKSFTIQSVTAMCVGKGDYIFTGMYTYHESEKIKGTFYNESIFVIRRVNGVEKFNKFHKEAVFSNFLSYYNRPLEGYEHYLAFKGYTLGVDLLAPMLQEDRFYFIGEISKMNMSAGSTSVSKIASSWDYQNGIVIAFDINGNLLWNDSYDLMVPGRTMSPTKRSNYHLTDDGIEFLVNGPTHFLRVNFSKEGELLEEKVYPKNVEYRKPKEMGDEVFYATEFWYDDFYLINGTDDIKTGEKVGREEVEIARFKMIKVKFK